MSDIIDVMYSSDSKKSVVKLDKKQRGMLDKYVDKLTNPPPVKEKKPPVKKVCKNCGV